MDTGVLWLWVWACYRYGMAVLNRTAISFQLKLVLQNEVSMLVRGVSEIDANGTERMTVSFC